MFTLKYLVRICSHANTKGQTSKGCILKFQCNCQRVALGYQVPVRNNEAKIFGTLRTYSFDLAQLSQQVNVHKYPDM